MNELRVEDIHAAYRKKEVLRGVSFSVGRGEILALIGPNGAGKSTLLKVVAGFLKPLDGHVWLNGKEIAALGPHERVKEGLAYFMQGGKVFSSLTVMENLEIGSISLSSAQRRERIASVFEIFSNLRDLLDRRAGLLSGGERQALALAMVLVKQPRLLLLDEPSAGLSPKLVRDMLEKVCEFNNSWGTTILLVEQSVREALNIAHRAMALVNGKVALETGNPKGLFTDGQLEQLFLGRGKDIALRKDGR